MDDKLELALKWLDENAPKEVWGEINAALIARNAEIAKYALALQDANAECADLLERIADGESGKTY